MKKQIKNNWDNLYLNKFNALPWIESELPTNLLKHFIDIIQVEKKILDYGCGNGRLSKILIEMEGNVTCADVSSIAIEQCKKRFSKNENVKFLVTDSPNNIKESFNGIVAWNVIHHIHPTLQFNFFESLFKRLTNQGVILLSGFSNSDLEFKENKTRISPTTNSITTSMTDNFFLNTIYDKMIIDRGEIMLRDGITNKIRTIRYFLLEKNTPNAK